MAENQNNNDNNENTSTDKNKIINNLSYYIDNEISADDSLEKQYSKL